MSANASAQVPKTIVDPLLHSDPKTTKQNRAGHDAVDLRALSENLALSTSAIQHMHKVFSHALLDISSMKRSMKALQESQNQILKLIAGEMLAKRELEQSSTHFGKAGLDISLPSEVEEDKERNVNGGLLAMLSGAIPSKGEHWKEKDEHHSMRREENKSGGEMIEEKGKENSYSNCIPEDNYNNCIRDDVEGEAEEMGRDDEDRSVDGDLIAMLSGTTSNEGKHEKEKDKQNSAIRERGNYGNCVPEDNCNNCTRDDGKSKEGEEREPRMIKENLEVCATQEVDGRESTRTLLARKEREHFQEYEKYQFKIMDLESKIREQKKGDPDELTRSQRKVEALQGENQNLKNTKRMQQMKVLSLQREVNALRKEIKLYKGVRSGASHGVLKDSEIKEPLVEDIGPENETPSRTSTPPAVDIELYSDDIELYTDGYRFFDDSVLKASEQNEEQKGVNRQANFIFAEKDITLMKVLGKGNFASTWLAKVNPTDTLVAVKIPKDETTNDEYKKEMIGLMNIAGHENVIKFLGIMKNKVGAQCFLTEFCDLGSLEDLHHRYDLRKPDIFWRIVFGLFSGLEHFRSVRMIHRDIACRNILVNHNFEIRIADFGLAVRAPNDEYVAQSHEKLPILWMPPETLKNGVFRPESDVWAAGVTLWEVINRGKVPYSNAYGEVPRQRELIPRIISGDSKLVVPKEPVWCFNVIQSCLRYDRADRVEPKTINVLDFAVSHKASLAYLLDSGYFTEEIVRERAEELYISPEEQFLGGIKGYDDWRKDLEKKTKIKIYGKPEHGRAFWSWCRFMPNLITLSIEFDYLDSIPTCIARLIHLKKLKIKSCELTSLPPEIGRLVRLETLNLDTNKITSIPAEIKSLVHLKTLTLDDNKLLSLPSEIKYLKHLQKLHLSNNCISSVPVEIRELHGLRVVLSGNNVKKNGVPPEVWEAASIWTTGIGSITNMKDLDEKLLAMGDVKIAMLKIPVSVDTLDANGPRKTTSETMPNDPLSIICDLHGIDDSD